MKKCIYTSLVASIISFTSLHTFAQPEQPIPVAASADKYELELVAKGVQIPWGMVWLNKQDLLVTNRAGDLRLIRDGKLLEKAIKGVPKVHAERQGGLLDVELDPNFKDNGWIYFSYSGYEGDDEGYNTSIMRARLKDMTLIDQQLLFDGSPNTTKRRKRAQKYLFVWSSESARHGDAPKNGCDLEPRTWPARRR
ncbi:PQQ-dependent sugar dehydrogenase [Pseudoalteromonas porphyrae]|uniref:PQQ-dependent sugar dehydrogenase n=1 Tax=Pseudoalteromonas porphyrae TaxID=187330 RepID=UPI0006C87D2C|nr:PQQ-dependent sugar dehydrogenase [Pseudoalteromonas porphyrae]